MQFPNINGSTGPIGLAGAALTLAGIQVQLVGDGSGTVDSGTNVIFDSLVLDTSANISCDDTMGEFFISVPGNYYITWWIAADGANGIAACAPVSSASLTAVP